VCGDGVVALFDASGECFKHIGVSSRVTALAHVRFVCVRAHARR
jgi:hypothetical protein